MRAAGVIALVALVGLAPLGCTRANPDYCDARTGCSGGRACDLAHNACVMADGGLDAAALDDGGAEAGPADAGPEAAPLCRVSRTDCTDPASPICEADAGVCQPCIQDAECVAAEPSLPACVGGRCYQCSTAADCTAGTPLCNAATNSCVQCTTDESCLAAAYTPGVCLAGDCPDADAVVWVSQESGCSDAGTGTPTAPFCGLQPAVDYVKGTAAAPRIIVVKPGAAPYGHVTVGGATLTLTIVGHLGTAVTVAGDAAHPALSVTSGATLTLRRLDFAGGSPAVVSCDSATCALDQTEIAGGALGVLATRALMLTLTRSAVHDNSAGGLSASQSDFVIENDFFYVNGAYAASVGGVTVASVPPGATARIVNNTFFSNLAAGAGAGVSCSPAGVGIVNSIVWQNLMAGAAPSSVTGCTVTYTLVDDAAIAGIAGANNLGPPVAPSFKAGTVPPYDLHLVAGSGGLCAGDATTAPTIDYDGEPRPTSCIDLGADQYSQ